MRQAELAGRQCIHPLTHRECSEVFGMNHTIYLRPYSPEDIVQTVRLWHASKRDAFPYVEVQQRYAMAADMAFLGAIVAAECVVWLAEVEGHLAGLLAIKDDYIDQLFVAVERQRQGVGTALLQKAREHSPRGLRLSTFQKN